MTEDPAVEEARQSSDRAVSLVGNVHVATVLVEPWIIVFSNEDRLNVVINKPKLLRTLSRKNEIMQAVDVLLVDMIKKFLNESAAIEASREKQK